MSPQAATFGRGYVLKIQLHSSLGTWIERSSGGILMGRLRRGIRSTLGNRWVRYLGGGGLAAAGAIITPFVPPAGIPIAAVGAGILAGGNVVADAGLVDERAQEAVRGNLRSLANTPKRTRQISDSCSIRGCVYAWDTGDNALKAEPKLGVDYQAMNTVRWGLDQGPIGLALSLGETQIYPDDLGPVSRSDLGSATRSWGG